MIFKVRCNANHSMSLSCKKMLLQSVDYKRFPLALPNVLEHSRQPEQGGSIHFAYVSEPSQQKGHIVQLNLARILLPHWHICVGSYMRGSAPAKCWQLFLHRTEWKLLPTHEPSQRLSQGIQERDESAARNAAVGKAARQTAAFCLHS